MVTQTNEVYDWNLHLGVEDVTENQGGTACMAQKVEEFTTSDMEDELEVEEVVSSEKE